MEIPEKWGLDEFNEMLAGVDANATLEEAGLTYDAVAKLAAFGLRHLVTEHDDEVTPVSLIEDVMTMGVGMFAAGMWLQQLLHEAKDDEEDETPMFIGYARFPEADDGEAS